LALENARRFYETEQGKALAQAAAANFERRLRDLAQDLTAIVWEVDAATWRTIYVSHAAEKILGYPVERWSTEGDFWLSHLHPDARRNQPPARPSARPRRARAPDRRQCAATLRRDRRAALPARAGFRRDDRARPIERGGRVVRHGRARHAGATCRLLARRPRR